MITFVAYAKEDDEFYQTSIDQPIGFVEIEDQIYEDNTHEFLLEKFGKQYDIVQFEWVKEDDISSIEIKPIIMPTPEQMQEYNKNLTP